MYNLDNNFEMCNNLEYIRDTLYKKCIKKISENNEYLTTFKYIKYHDEDIKYHDENIKLFIKALSKNTNLQEVIIIDNSLQYEGFTYVLKSLQENKYIKKFILEFNSKNINIICLCDFLKKNTILEKIQLSCKDINDYMVKHIMEALQVNIGIKEVYIKGELYFKTKISYIGAKYIGEVLQVNNNLSSLNLSQNKIGDEGVKYLVEGMKKNNSLKILDISDNNISDEGIKYFYKGLKNNNIIEELYLGHNEIFNDGMKYISKFLEVNNSLTILCLSSLCTYDDNDDDNYDDDLKSEDENGDEYLVEGIKFISNSLQRNKSLKKLILSYNNVGSDGCKYLAEMLKHNNSLIELKLESCNIKSFKYLAKGLEINKGLNILSLCENEIDDIGIKPFCEMLKVNNTLCDIDLSNNNIGDEGIVYLCECVKENSGLLMLNVIENHFMGVKYNFYELLNKNKSLIKLDIGNIYIDQEYIEYLANGLKVNTTLKNLKISYYDIKPKYKKYLVDSLKINNTLEKLTIITYKNENDEYFLKHKKKINWLAEIIENNSSLIDIEYYPQLPYTDIRPLFKAFMKNKTIKFFSLRGCIEKNSDKILLFKVLFNNTTLEKFNMSDYYYIDSLEIFKINNFLERNKEKNIREKEFFNMCYCLDNKNINIPTELKDIIWNYLIHLPYI